MWLFWKSDSSPSLVFVVVCSVTFLNEFCRVCISRWALALKSLFRQLSGWPVVRDFPKHVTPVSLPVFVRLCGAAGHSGLCPSLHFLPARAFRSAGAVIQWAQPCHWVWPSRFPGACQGLSKHLCTYHCPVFPFKPFIWPLLDPAIVHLLRQP